MKATEETLIFQQVRELTVQWSVRVSGAEVCLVTERVVASPPYALRFPDGRMDYAEDRQGVLDKILAVVNKEDPSGP